MNRRDRSHTGVLLLFLQMYNVGMDHIPKVTLAAILGQVMIYMQVFPVPTIRQACVSVLNVWYVKDYRRLVLATFFHADDWHLYYNMLSFLWKGKALEPRVGSLYFGLLIAVFSLLTNCLLLAINSGLELLLHRAAFLTDCAVGFSGVLFALKVVMTHQSRDRTILLGFIPIQTRYAVWAELLIIQLVTPNVSFVGHLAGILVGLGYTLGPLRVLLEPFRPSPFTRPPSAPTPPRESAEIDRDEVRRRRLARYAQ